LFDSGKLHLGYSSPDCIQIDRREATAIVPEAKTRDGQHVALVHDRLRDAILRGEIPPGQPTSQVVLARQLGVSRTPLREALRLLQREGLILSEPNRRIRVAEFSLADVEELYSMRIALEVVAIRLTVPTLTSEDFAELEGLMAQMDHYMREGDQRRMDVPHSAFHSRLVGAAGLRVTTTMKQLFDHAQRYRLAYGAMAPDGYEGRRAEHRAIVDSAAEGDAEAASSHLAAHYTQTAMLVIRQLDPGHDPVLLRTTLETVAPGAAAAVSA
jgi:DNA-binding GntR family transcriptional regulator